MSSNARGVRNHNPLNIRHGNDWQGETSSPQDKAFESFINDAYGFRAGFRIIHNGFKAKPPRNTIRRIITRWAPPGDHNDTAAYINTVAQRSGISADEVLAYNDCDRMCRIVRAMAFVETGHDYSPRVVLSGYLLEK